MKQHRVAGLMGICFWALVVGPAGAAERIEADRLSHLPLEGVPEEVVVLGIPHMSRHESKGVFCRAYILEAIPSSWSVSKTSRLSLSGAHSQAGAKSIRWDWKRGDVLRIRNLKGLSRGTVAPFKLSLYQDRPLPAGSRVRVYFRARDHLIRDSYWMQYANWYTIGRNDFLTRQPLEQFKIQQMPAGVRAPEVDELVIRAPGEVMSGTFHLDRLLVNLIDRNVGVMRPDIVTHGIPEKPYDPGEHEPNPHGFTTYYGLYAARPAPPDALTGEQKRFLARVKPPLDVDLNATPREGAREEAEARELLRTVLVRQPDGSYRYPQRMNIAHYSSWTTPIFPGDVCVGWKEPGVTIKGLLHRYSLLYRKYPGSEPIEAVFKALLDWMKYQGLERGKAFGPQMHSAYGVRGLPRAGVAIPVFLAKGTKKDLAFAEHLSGLIRWYTSSYCDYLTTDEVGAHGEPGVSEAAAYAALFVEYNDRRLYRDLTLYRDKWARMLSISDVGSKSIIKPDYSFFHHGHLIGYWSGNYGGYTRAGLRFRNSPLEYDPVIYNNLARHSVMFLYGFGTVTDSNPWLLNTFFHQRKSIGVRRYPKSTRVLPEYVGGFDRFFDDFYGMDWERVPAARKFVSAALRDYHAEPELLARILARYPKARAVRPADQFHLSLNWAATSVFVTGYSRVHARGYNSMAGSVPEPEPKCVNQWARGFGSLFVHESSLVNGDESPLYRAHLGGNAHGYDWTRTSGVTMPKVSPEESESFGTGGIGGYRVDDWRGRSLYYSGSVTHGETDERLGRYGNMAIHIRPETTAKLAKYVGKFRGNKSYHFLGDQVVCLGSGYRADEAPRRRAMETVLFQQSVDEEFWESRDKRRWNPASPAVVVGGKRYDRKGSELAAEVARTTYVISPYGHAWILPAQRRSTLRLKWADQSSLFSGQVPGGGKVYEPRTGEFVTAWLDHGDSGLESGHEYCLLLNSTGRDAEAYERHVREHATSPRYEGLRRDDVAHAVRAAGGGVHSYVVWAPDAELGLPHVAGVNRRLNVMCSYDPKTRRLELSVADSAVQLGRGDKDQRSPDREVVIRFSRRNARLVKAESGLPQTNPRLDARIEDGNKLVYNTRNGVSDNFVISFPD
jgi:hypothetical protein